MKTLPSTSTLDQLTSARKTHREKTILQREETNLQYAVTRLEAEFYSKEPEITELLNRVVFTETVEEQQFDIRVVDILEKLIQATGQTVPNTNIEVAKDWCLFGKSTSVKELTSILTDEQSIAIRDKALIPLLKEGLLTARYNKGSEFEEVTKSYAYNYSYDGGSCDWGEYTSRELCPQWVGVNFKNYNDSGLGLRDKWVDKETTWNVAQLGVLSYLESKHQVTN